MKTKMKSVLALVVICAGFAITSKSQIAVKDGEVWVGIGYIAAKNGASAEAGAAIGAIGILDAAAWGFGVGMVAGPVGGAVAGAVAGL